LRRENYFGSIFVCDYIANRQAGVAQLVEQLICNHQVGGSSPFTGSIISFDDLPQSLETCQKEILNKKSEYRVFNAKFAGNTPFSISACKFAER
jgi:hypothetical protein